MKNLKFEVSIPAEQIERLVHSSLMGTFGFGAPGITVKMKEEFKPSHGMAKSEEINLQEEGEENYVEKAETISRIGEVTSKINEFASRINNDCCIEPKEMEKKSYNSTRDYPNKLIAFRCDCGHITWKMCRDGDYSCDCYKCGENHIWDNSELYRLDYLCKCGCKRYLYMPLSHYIVEIKCGECKAPIDITFNDKSKRFDQVK